MEWFLFRSFSRVGFRMNGNVINVVIANVSAPY